MGGVPSGLSRLILTLSPYWNLIGIGPVCLLQAVDQVIKGVTYN